MSLMKAVSGKIVDVTIIVTGDFFLHICMMILLHLYRADIDKIFIRTH